MDIQTRDGITLRNIPEGTPEEAIKARIAMIRAERGGAKPSQIPPPDRKIGPPQELTWAERNIAPALEALGVDRMTSARPAVQALADPVFGVVKMAADAAPGVAAWNPTLSPLRQEISGLAGKVSNAIKDQEEEYQQSRGSDAGSLDPVRILVGAANPLYWTLGRIPQAAGAIGRVGQGVGIGSSIGLATSRGDPEERMASGLAGGVLGGVLPGVGAGGEWISKATRGLTSSPQMAFGRTAVEASGPRRELVIEALSKAKPGQTAGQAAVPAGSAEFSALEKMLRERDPSRFEAIDRAQESARSAALRSYGKTKADLSMAEAARSAVTDPLYQAARRGTTDVSGVIAKIDDVLERNPGNAELVRELSKIRSGLVTRGPEGEEVIRTRAEQVLSTLPTIKASLSNPENKLIAKTLNEIKDDIVAAVPGMRQADEMYAELSRPVNQMQVGQYLERKLHDPLGKSERARAFATALEDPSLGEKATGFGGKITLTPRQAQVTDAVMGQLKTDAELERLISAGVPRAREITGEASTAFPTVPLLNRIATVTNAIVKRLEGAGSKASLEAGARVWENPQELARLMKEATPKERRQLVDALMRLQAAGVGVGVGQE